MFWQPQCHGRLAFTPLSLPLTTLALLFSLMMLAERRCAAETSGRVQRLVLSHYMPWYTANAESNQWGWHWTMNHFDPSRLANNQREIASHFYPLIGPYDSGDRDVLEYHLLLMKLAGIDGVIVDWYGLTDYRDYAILHQNTTRLVEMVERLGMRFVICYEDQTIPSLIEAGRLAKDDAVTHAANEIRWLDEHWFGMKGYVKLRGEPVLLSFGHAGLTNDQWTECLRSLRLPLAYYSEHERRDAAIGAFDWPIPKQGADRVRTFVEMSRAWKESIPVAFPRFIDIYAQAKVGEGYGEIADEDGKTFRATLSVAVNAKAKLIQLATWNDWGEGTQIEPSVEFGYRDLEVVQATRRQSIDRSFAMKPEHLRLPIRLYQLRKSQPQTGEKLETIAKNLAGGNVELATRQIDYLEAGLHQAPPR